MLFLPAISLLGCDALTDSNSTVTKPAVSRQSGSEHQKPIVKRKSISPLEEIKKLGSDYWEGSDFPLVIQIESTPVPEEIKGPFPENAAWRTKE
jgi:hypothetical protein